MNDIGDAKSNSTETGKICYNIGKNIYVRHNILSKILLKYPLKETEKDKRIAFKRLTSRRDNYKTERTTDIRTLLTGNTELLAHINSMLLSGGKYSQCTPKIEEDTISETRKIQINYNTHYADGYKITSYDIRLDPNLTGLENWYVIDTVQSNRQHKYIILSQNSPIIHGGSNKTKPKKPSKTKPKKPSKTKPKKISKTKTKKSPKLYTGPRGGKYIVKKGKKIYQ